MSTKKMLPTTKPSEFVLTLFLFLGGNFVVSKNQASFFSVFLKGWTKHIWGGKIPENLSPYQCGSGTLLHVASRAGGAWGFFQDIQDSRFEVLEIEPNNKGTGWWQFQTFFGIFIPTFWGRWTHFDAAYFFRWVGEKPPSRVPLSPPMVKRLSHSLQW